MGRDNSVTWNRVIPSSFNYSAVNALVVGGTGGLGRSISQDLLGKGAKVTVVGTTLRDEESENFRFIKTDLSLVKNCEEVVQKLIENDSVKDFTHIIFTTGIIASRTREETSEGLERDMAISYLSRYIILKGIGSQISKSFTVGGKTLKPRVFVMGYPGKGYLGNPDDMNADPAKYSFMAAHLNTVAANESLVLHYAKQSNSFNIYGLNPFLVRTNIRSNLIGTGFFSRQLENLINFFQQTPAQYASNLVPLFVTPDIENNNGTLFDNKINAMTSSKGIDANVEKFWNKSAELVEIAHSK